MAFNWQTFKTRTLTALVFAAVMLTGLLWNHWSFFVLFSIIHFGCWVEYQRLVAKIDPGYKEITPFHRYGVMLAGWCLMLWFSGDMYNFLGMHLQEIGWWLGLILVFLLPIMELLFTKHIRLKNIAHSFFGLLYISLSWGLMMDLYGSVIDIHFQDTMFVFGMGILPLIIVLSIWINDTMAYIVGSLVGKTPLTTISPKKTWEGTVGGIFLAVAFVGILFPLVYFKTFAFQFTGHIVPVVAIAAIAGTFGDLLESKLKRLAGVKDSGNLLPGHGGFLDRFDSLLLATPFVWLYVQLLMR
jgi:phosphatidate cytidylyltransferase